MRKVVRTNERDVLEVLLCRLCRALVLLYRSLGVSLLLLELLDRLEVLAPNQPRQLLLERLLLLEQVLALLESKHVAMQGLVRTAKVVQVLVALGTRLQSKLRCQCNDCSIALSQYTYTRLSG